MRRLLPLCLFVLLLPSPPAAQEPKPPEPAAEAKAEAIPTLAPGHHVGRITAMAFTPDGKRLVTGGEDKTIQVWDFETGNRLRLFRPPVGPGFAGAITSLAIAPDGKTLAVGATPIPVPGKKNGVNAAYLLNLDDGRIRPLAVTVATAVRGVTFSRDGRQLFVSGMSSSVFTDLGDAWRDTAPLKPSKELPGRSVLFGISPNGESFLAGERFQSETVRVIDAKTGKVAAELETGRTRGVAWCADGEKILTGHLGTDTTALRVWRAGGGQPIKEFTAKEILGAKVDARLSIFAIVHRSGSEYLLFAHQPSRPTVILFDIATGAGTVLGSFTYDGELEDSAAAVSADGRWGAVPWAPRGQRVALFEFGKPGVRYLSGPAEVNRDAGWTADGKSVTWSRALRGGKFADKTGGLNLRSLEQTARVDGPILRATTRQGGATLTRNRGRSGLQVELARGDTKVAVVGAGNAFTLPAAGPIGWFVAAEKFNRGLSLYDATSAKLLRKFEPLGQEVASVASSPDGKYLFALDDLGVGRVYRPDVAQPLLSVYTEDQDWVAWTEEGYYAASPNGERLLGWTVNAGLTKEANLVTAEQFRATLYRPDVIALLLDKGSVKDAAEAANKARKDVPRGAADPDRILPPVVEVTVDRSALPKVTVKVTATQGCPGQPVKSLRLLIDNRPLADPQYRVTYPDGMEKEGVTKEWSIVLEPGRHRLSVLARSKDDTPSVSSPVLVESQLPVTQRPVVHHVAIGISAYKEAALKLGVARKDAEGLAAALRATCASKDNVYRDVDTTLLTDAQATRGAILEAVGKVRAAAKGPDLFVLSFAGHGVRADGEFFLLTHEAKPTSGHTLAGTALSGRDLRLALADFPCQVLLLLDACHAGAFAADKLGAYKPATDDAARALADVELRVAVMCAAQGHEEALEGEDNGHFTRAVIRALQGDKDAFYDRATREVNVYHLQAFVYQTVAGETDNKQNPYLKMPLAHPPVVVTRFPTK